jgi:glycine betaine/proline transport system ATP-binding protein
MAQYDDNADMSDIRVSQNAIIETIAERVLSEQKTVAVTDEQGEIVGVLNSKIIIQVLFGEANVIPVNDTAVSQA